MFISNLSHTNPLPQPPVISWLLTTYHLEEEIISFFFRVREQMVNTLSLTRDKVHQREIYIKSFASVLLCGKNRV